VALDRISSLEDETKSLRSESRQLCLSRSRNLAAQMIHCVVKIQPKVFRSKDLNFSQLVVSGKDSNLTSLLANVHGADTTEERLQITRHWDLIKTKRDFDIHPCSLTNLESEMKASRKMLHRHGLKGDAHSHQETANLDVLDRFEGYKSAKLGNFAPAPVLGKGAKSRFKASGSGQKGARGGARPGSAPGGPAGLPPGQILTVTVSAPRANKRARGES
jgi:hypothetical protein